MQAADHEFVAGYLRQSSEALAAYAQDPAQVAVLNRMAGAVSACFSAGGKLLIAGNGGSAGDAQHLAGEFTGRMLYDRAPLPAIALHADTSALTAIGNDYGFVHVFERQVQALGRPGDVLLALSTSGNSANVLLAMDAARGLGLHVHAFTGADARGMASRADLLMQVPSSFTPVIQQVYMVAGHLLCSLVERAMFPRAA